MVTIHGLHRCLQQLYTNTFVSWILLLNVACLRMVLVSIITCVMIGSQAIFVNSGTLFLAVKCPDSSETYCIGDSPSETHSSISKGQCSNACNRLGWAWFNFIAEEFTTQCGIGTCQLFATEPQNLTQSSSCTAYEKASVNLSAVSICQSIDIPQISPYLVHVVPRNFRIRAGALFNDELFFVEGTRVFAYDTISMRVRIIIDSLGSIVYGLAINANTSMLYVSDTGNDCVRWMNLDQSVFNGYWNVMSPYGLSINDAGNVVVVSLSLRSLIEYTPGGTLVKQIPLGTNVAPTQAVEFSNNTFVVTSAGSGFGLQGVFTTTSTGQVINSYGSLACSGAGQMNEPRGVVVDDDGFFVVADRNNDRVLVFNPSLSDVCQLSIHSSVNLTQPWSLTYDQARGRLYVGESGDGSNRILVFDGITNLKSFFC